MVGIAAGVAFVWVVGSAEGGGWVFRLVAFGFVGHTQAPSFSNVFSFANSQEVELFVEQIQEENRYPTSTIPTSER